MRTTPASAMINPLQPTRRFSGSPARPAAYVQTVEMKASSQIVSAKVTCPTSMTWKARAEGSRRTPGVRVIATAKASVPAMAAALIAYSSQL